jgi:hypothetical protein
MVANLYTCLASDQLASRTQKLQALSPTKTTTYGRAFGATDSVSLPSLAPSQIPKQSESPTFKLQSSQLIGSRVDQSLEVYGRYAPNARGKRNAEHALGWPREGLP